MAGTATLTRDPWRLALLVVGALSLVRLFVLFATPLELYPDEAQYWLWSRELAFGYYSKPPLVAWLIALTTAVGGNEEPWVRISSLLLHAATPLVLFQVGARLYDRWTGLWAAVLYSLMPGVQLSAGIVSTDASLMFLLSLALWAYARLQDAGPGRARLWAAAGFGAALGAAFLSKYAALYFVAGLALHLALSRRARRAWSPGAGAAAAGGFLLLASPNLAWNAANGFATVSHTADNADWEPGELFNPDEMLEFMGSQLGVFGPIPFVVLLVGLGLALRRRSLDPRDLLLTCFLAPPLALVTVQALLSRANANWAAVAYVAASVLVAAWLVRRGARRTLGAAVAIQAVVAAVFMAATVSPALADGLGLANAFKRTRGWEEGAQRIMAAAAAQAPLAAIAVDDRFLFNALAYYGRDALAAPGAPPLKAWVRKAHPENQAETFDPLTPQLGRRVLVASINPYARPEIAADFARFGAWTDASVRLDANRERDLALAVGEGFAPRPRDPVSGLPTPP